MDEGVDPSVDGWGRLPPNALAAFYRWGLDHRRAGPRRTHGGQLRRWQQCPVTSNVWSRGSCRLLSPSKLRLGLRLVEAPHVKQT